MHYHLIAYLQLFDYVIRGRVMMMLHIIYSQSKTKAPCERPQQPLFGHFNRKTTSISV